MRRLVRLASPVLIALLMGGEGRSANVLHFKSNAESDSGVQTGMVGPSLSPAVQQLLSFQQAEIKFDLSRLMIILRDHQHEGWVLYAYADPTTHRPLIGAGFSLDLPEREHAQQDSSNPHPFLEPSSADLWRAAGLDADKLQSVLMKFDERPMSRVRRSRSRIKKQIPPDITDEEATRLLKIAAIQAVYNAKAYCRSFDSLSASQQMAMTQLVYQMGVNLDEFHDFLSLLNADTTAGVLALGPAEFDTEHWRAIQETLIDSRWATLYRTRASSVIAMFDPLYADDAQASEAHVDSSFPAVPGLRERGSEGTKFHLASNRRRGHTFTARHTKRKRKRN